MTDDYIRVAVRLLESVHRHGKANGREAATNPRRGSLPDPLLDVAKSCNDSRTFVPNHHLINRNAENLSKRRFLRHAHSTQAVCTDRPSGSRSLTNKATVGARRSDTPTRLCAAIGSNPQFSGAFNFVERDSGI
jgi:hypothetical protein